MQKLDKQKIEIQIVSYYWDYARSGLCLYNEQLCWFEEVKAGLSFGDNQDSNDPHFNGYRSRFEVYALTKTDADIITNRFKKFAKQLGQATHFCRDGRRIFSEKESKALVDSFVVDEELFESTKDKEPDLSYCIGYYYNGVPKNTLDIMFEDLGTTRSSIYQPPTTASIKRFEELKPMLNVFKPDYTYYYIVDADYDGGINIEYEFNHEFNHFMNIHIDSTGQTSFCIYKHTPEFNTWIMDPERDKKPKPETYQIIEGKL